MSMQASRILRLERLAETQDADPPVAAVVDEEGLVLKVMGRAGEWRNGKGRYADELPDGVKVYEFDPEMADLYRDV